MERNKKQTKTKAVCISVTYATALNLVLVSEYLNELRSAFHYLPSGEMAGFVQQLLVILA